MLFIPVWNTVDTSTLAVPEPADEAAATSWLSPPELHALSTNVLWHPDDVTYQVPVPVSSSPISWPLINNTLVLPASLEYITTSPTTAAGIMLNNNQCTTTTNVSVKKREVNKRQMRLTHQSVYPLYCDACRMALNAPGQAKDHFLGKHHAKRVRRLQQRDTPVTPAVSSDACQVTVNQSTMSTTSVGDTLCSDKKPEADKPPAGANIDSRLHCVLCNARFNSLTQAQHHYEGRSHHRRLTVPSPVNKRPTVSIPVKRRLNLSSGV